jgi:hypothetical protein
MQQVRFGTAETFAFLETTAKAGTMTADADMSCHAAANSTDVGAGAEPAKMGAAAKTSHMPATATATRFRCGGEQARGKQGCGQDHCQSSHHDTSFP